MTFQVSIECVGALSTLLSVKDFSLKALGKMTQSVSSFIIRTNNTIKMRVGE